MAAFCCRQYDCCLLAAIVLFASVNYWRHAVKGMRRNVDMFCAVGGLLYQVSAFLALVVSLCGCSSTFSGEHITDTWEIEYLLLCLVGVHTCMAGRGGYDRYNHNPAVDG